MNKNDTAQLAILAVLIAIVTITAGLVDASRASPACQPTLSPLAVPTLPPAVCDCSCTYLPDIEQQPVTATPYPTAIPEPTATATPQPPWPDTDAYTQTTVLIWPRNQTADTGAPLTERVILVDRDDVYAFEMAIVVSPAVVMPITATLATSTTCELFNVKFDKATIRVECEGLRLGPSGALLDLALTCAAPGMSLIDSAGVWGTFAGTGSGWGFWPQVGAAWVTCE